MDELIYSFLLQSDYPRASVILDSDLIGPAIRAGSGTRVPSFIIVDPDSAQTLAVIEVVDAVDGDTLRQVATETGAYAEKLGNKAIQGFLIRVDVRGRTEEEQVQFYRVWPNNTLQQLTSKTFPDLETLRVARKLADSRVAAVTKQPEIVDAVDMDAETEPGPGAGMYFPGVVLLLLILVDSYFKTVKGAPLLSLSQSVLAFGAALLFALPGALRYLRR
ncbi:MAG: hypothetical protein AB8B79_05255 [Granulosicoccus sp.]